MRLSVPPGALALGRLWAALLELGTALALVGLGFAAWAPPQDQPWTPLRLADPPGLFTDYKLMRAAADPQRCRAVLNEGGVAFDEAPERNSGRCAIRNAVLLREGTTALAPGSPAMTCPLALSYAFWTRHEVEPAARELLGSPPTRIDHFGTYACRNVRGGSALSQHAFANALDVAAFRLADGRWVTVARDFERDDARGRFLHRVRDGACRWFEVVLTPDYNAAHQDHLHLDRGRWSRCS